MDLRVLRYFLAAVESGTITGAAERLRITQPNLSRQLIALEDELGVALFIRSNRRLTVTPAGERLAERARMMLELADKTAEEVRSASSLAGTVRIAAGETPAFAALAQAFARLRAEAPLVRIDIVSGSEETVRMQLHSGLTDFGLFVGTADASAYSSLALRTRDRWGVLMRSDDPLSSKPFIRPQDLEDEPLLLSRQAFDRNELAGWFGSIRPQIVATFNLLYNAALLAEAGVGRVLALDGIIRSDALAWRPLGPALEAEIRIVWPRERPLAPPARRLLELLRDEERKA